MTAYPTLAALLEAYERKLQLDGKDATIAAIIAADAWVYVPHLYRGGSVVRGFGYSVERVGVYVPAERAGDPLAV